MSFNTERARVAALSRDRDPNDPDLLNARRNMRTERLAERIRREVDDWPPLTPAQRERLADILRGEAG